MTSRKIIYWFLMVLVLLLLSGTGVWYFVKPDKEWVSAIGTAISAAFSIASVLAVVLVWEQLKQNQRQLELNTSELEQTKNIAQLQFEDALEKEYRDLVSRIPTKALLGSGLSPVEYEAAFDELFRYIDLSNEQVLLRMNKRISSATWENWSVGIRANLELPVFRRAWSEVRSKSSSFKELRKLENDRFLTDPATWS